MTLVQKDDLVKVFPKAFAGDLSKLGKSLRIIASGTAVATAKGRDLVPEADFALSCVRDEGMELLAAKGMRLSFETVTVSREEALRFLSKEPLTLADAPRGFLLLTYEGQGLGFVKNLGNRCNSLLPASRRIRIRM